ncbi:MAG: DNA replication and repair protein RadC [archaeon GW2011_AR20]|nr:MAG: DNA replication and repair protein RadC [archaeon GW2011_AR20]MBS3160631.1 DNA repair protein RadC [Candidatus Woesearchaeota archaeon]
MKIKEIPWFNRPGFKLTRNGVNSLDDAELLSIIFGVGSKGESALELSNKLLKKYNFNNLENLSIKELAKECKSYNKALQLISLIELSKRYNKLINGGYDNKIKHKKINSAKDVKNIFIDKFRNYKKEVLSIILLDTKNKIISFKEGITIGILNSSLIHPREIFKEAIKESANSVILVHNHPSGDPNPSQKDIEITKKIFEAGELLGINVLDHVIIGDESYWSYKENRSNNAP